MKMIRLLCKFACYLSSFFFYKGSSLFPVKDFVNSISQQLSSRKNKHKVEPLERRSPCYKQSLNGGDSTSIMPKEEEDGSNSILENKLDAVLERNKYLEKENELLKQEVNLLKSQIELSQVQDANKRPIHWNKKNGSGCISNIQDKQDRIISKLATLSMTKARSTRVPNPPPKPSTDLLMPNISGKASWLPPPPPPPIPAKLLGGSSTNMLRRVPEVVELYRALTRKKENLETRTTILGAPVVINPREMIGEIEHRSAYLLAIKSDAETQVEFINFLTKQVENAEYKEITDLEAFVKWLDGELSYLVDERAVLKHFPKWPEKKADAMREAAFSYRDLKNLESEVSSFHYAKHQTTPATIKRLQGLQDKLECRVHNLERTRENAIKKYCDFQIPWEWMLDDGIIAKLKLSSLKLAKVFMDLVVASLTPDILPEDGDLIFQSARFAYRVHQFAGGFDEESRCAFHELKELASNNLN